MRCASVVFLLVGYCAIANGAENPLANYPRACPGFAFVQKRSPSGVALNNPDNSPAVLDGVMYTVHRGNAVFARDEVTANVVWSYANPSVIGAATVVDSNQVLVCTRTALVVLDSTGAPVRQFDIPAGAGIPCNRGRPTLTTLSGSTVALIATDRGRLYCIDVSTMGQVWTAYLGIRHGVNGPLSLWNDKVVGATYSGRVFARNLVDGSAAGAYQIPGVPLHIVNAVVHGVITGALIVGNTLFVATSTATSNFHAVDLSTMTAAAPSITLSAGYVSYTTPVSFGDLVFTTTSDGAAYVLTLQAGQIVVVGTAMIPRKIIMYGPVALSPDGTVLFVQATYGHFFAIEVATGQQLDRFFNYKLGTFMSTALPRSRGSGVRLYAAGGMQEGVIDTVCTTPQPTPVPPTPAPPTPAPPTPAPPTPSPPTPAPLPTGSCAVPLSGPLLFPHQDLTLEGSTSTGSMSSQASAANTSTCQATFDSSAELVFNLTATADAACTFQVSDPLNQLLYVRELDGCQVATQLACTSSSAYLTVAVHAGLSYAIIVDSALPTAVQVTGHCAYPPTDTLKPVTLVPPPPPTTTPMPPPPKPGVPQTPIPSTPAPIDAMLAFVATLECPQDPSWTESTPLCSRNGVTCDESGGWTGFSLALPPTTTVWCNGTAVDVSLLPSSLRTLSLWNLGLTGTIAWDQLPAGLTNLKLADNTFSGTVPFEKLPVNIREVHLQNNQFDGPVAWTQLPPGLDIVQIEQNSFSGPVDLTSLPEHMVVISAWSNSFSGSIDITHLPDTFRYLAFTWNLLDGPLDATALPRNMSYLDLGGNYFSGSLDLTNLPAGTPSWAFEFRVWGSIDVCGVDTFATITCDALSPPDSCSCSSYSDASNPQFLSEVTCSPCATPQPPTDPPLPPSA